MIENKEIGLKIAESEEEALIHETIKATKKRIREMELAIDLDKIVLSYLEGKISNLNDED